MSRITGVLSLFHGTKNLPKILDFKDALVSGDLFKVRKKAHPFFEGVFLFIED